MPNFNPNFPEVLGLEWLATHGQTSRVWAGAPARMMRLPSTVTETILGIGLSVSVNPMLKHDTRTLIDVIEEGKEATTLFTPIELIPNDDVTINGWRTNTGSAVNLHLAINEDATRWSGPGSSSPAAADWIENTNPNQTYVPTYDTTAFEPGGSLANARIGFVSALAIYGANTGFRKLRTRMQIGANIHLPAGGDLRDVQSHGAPYVFWFGELNPDTGKPWVPADIAKFGPGGTSKLYVQSHSATTAQFPKVYALRMQVYLLPIENRVAVGVWRRPETLTARLNTIFTDALIMVPSGAANWSKAAGKNYLLHFRQSVTPSLFGAVNADDVRWIGAFQDLGPKGQPPGIVYPLHRSGVAPPPPNVFASDLVAHDQFGRPQLLAPTTLPSRAAYAFGLLRSDLAVSADSQPYRLDLTDLAFVHATQKLGQRVTPASAQTYLGVRVPIIPPRSGSSTLRVTVHLVSTGAQVGGTFSISAAAVRVLPATTGGVRYVSGFLSSAAALSAATAYEIRLSTDRAPASDPWVAIMPNCSTATTASFGGTTDGAFVGPTHFGDRDLSVNLVRQPDPPTSLVAAIVNVPISTSAAEVTTVQHVSVTWTKPAVSMGALFSHYELERSLDGGAFEPCAKIRTEQATNYVDHIVPRTVPAKYQLRAVGVDGRFSSFATSGSVTPTAPGAIVVLTSDHRPELELVYVYDPESSYPILSAEADETIAIHGADYQVVFSEEEDRGIGWRTRITINQITLSGKGGEHVLKPLIKLVRSLEIPYVVVMDRHGTRILGHVQVSEVARADPFHRYTAQIDVIPTHAETIPVEIEPLVQEDNTLLAFGTVQITGTLAATQQKQTLAAVGVVT